jgi:hypothetical protein
VLGQVSDSRPQPEAQIGKLQLLVRCGIDATELEFLHAAHGTFPRTPADAIAVLEHQAPQPASESGRLA